MKQLKHIILAAVLMASAMPAFADTVTYDSITYEVTGMAGSFYTVKVVDGSQRHSAVTIPTTMTVGTNKYRVLYIGDSAFINNTKITNVVLPSGLRTIGDYAFSGCTALASVFIPKSLQTYGAYSFYNCSSLKKIHFKSGTTQIGDYAFKGCTSLNEVIVTPSNEQVEVSNWPTAGENTFDATTLAQAYIFSLNPDWDFSKEDYAKQCIPWSKFVKHEDLNLYFFDDSWKKSGITGYSGYISRGSYSCDYNGMEFTLNNLIFTYGYLRLPKTSCKLILEEANEFSSRYYTYNEKCYGLLFNPVDKADSLVIEGSGTLEVLVVNYPIQNSKDFRAYTGAISASGNLVIRKCSVTARGNYGITSAKYTDIANLTIDSATVYATGNAYYDNIYSTLYTNPSIAHFDEINLKNCYIASPKGAYLEYKASENWKWHTRDDSGYVYTQVAILPKAAPAALKGDVNGDGKVDTSDLSELISIILNNGTATDYPRADVNGDSKVDTTDISALMSIILSA